MVNNPRMHMLGKQNVRKLIGNYEKLREIGRGTYGCVYEGRHVTSKQRVAIKKVYASHAVGDKEAELLQLCQQCDHVVKLLEVVRQHGKVYLILEYMPVDLEFFLPKELQQQAETADDDLQSALMSIACASSALGDPVETASPVPPLKPPELLMEQQQQQQQQQQLQQSFVLEMEHVKFFLFQLLEAVAEIHAQDVVHRDLKPNNLLFNDETKQAKLTDFGMARKLLSHPNEKLSIQVVTRAYRAPELFFGKESYGKEIDIWSVGCVFAEMVLRKPLFDGASDIDHLSQIFTILGSPSENGWHEASSLPFFLRFKDKHPRPLRDIFGSPQESCTAAAASSLTASSATTNGSTVIDAPDADADADASTPAPLMMSDKGVHLLSQLLQVVPAKRITAKEALAHEFFEELPYAKAPPMLPRPSSSVLKKRSITQQQRPSLDDDQEAFGDCSFAIKGRRIA